MKHHREYIALGPVARAIVGAFCVGFAATSASAGAVAVVDQGTAVAQAFSFAHGTACYALLPHHAIERPITPTIVRSRVSLLGGQPPKQGEGNLTALRFPGDQADYALVQVRGPLATDCAPTWRDLSRDLGNVFAVGTLGTLTTLRSNGLIERTPVVVTLVGYEEVRVQPAAESEEWRFGKGRSGSLLSIGTIPAGILLRVDDTDGDLSLVVRRLDAITTRIARFLEGAGATPELRARVDDRRVVPYRVVSWNKAPVSPDAGPTILETPGAGPAIIPPMAGSGGNFRMRLDLAPGGGTVAFAGIAIESSGARGTTGPQKIVLSRARSQNDPKSIGFYRTTLSEGGVSEVEVRPRNIRWLDIEILNTWNPAVNLRIDSLVVLSAND